jgi:hypothetical protein
MKKNEKDAIKRAAIEASKRSAKSELKKLESKLLRNSAKYAHLGGGTDPSAVKRQLHMSTYSYSLYNPEKLNVKSPDLGPFPTREFTLVTKFTVKTAAANPGVVAWDVTPAELYPTAPNTNGAGFLHMYYGTTIDPVGGAIVIGTGQTNDTAGPTWLDSLKDIASQAFLNSASVQVDYIGGTFNDAGALSYALLPMQDDGSAEPAPPYSTKLSVYPMGGSAPAPSGVHMVWLPKAYGVPQRVFIQNQTSVSGYKSSFFRFYAEGLGVDNGNEAFLVTVTQNFSFLTQTKVFADNVIAATNGVHGLQREVEKRAVNKMAHSAVNEDTPLAVNLSEKGKFGNKEMRKRNRSLGKFLKSAWEEVSPFTKIAWNNRNKIGNYISDMMSPASTSPELGWTSEVIGIEEVTEAAELAPLLLTL